MYSKILYSDHFNLWLGRGMPMDPYITGYLVSYLRKKMAPKDLVVPPSNLFPDEDQETFLDDVQKLGNSVVTVCLMVRKSGYVGGCEPCIFLRCTYYPNSLEDNSGRSFIGLVYFGNVIHCVIECHYVLGFLYSHFMMAFICLVALMALLS